MIIGHYSVNIESDAWNVKFTREFDITNDHYLFNENGQGLPLYEGKQIHQFNAFFGKPRFWLEEQPASNRLASKYRVAINELDYLKSRLAFRRDCTINRSKNTNTGDASA